MVKIIHVSCLSTMKDDHQGQSAEESLHGAVGLECPEGMEAKLQAG